MNAWREPGIVTLRYERNHADGVVLHRSTRDRPSVVSALQPPVECIDLSLMLPQSRQDEFA